MDFNPRASEIHGISVNQYGELQKNGHVIHGARSLCNGLEIFLDFLSDFDNNQDLVLVSEIGNYLYNIYMQFDYSFESHI